MTKLIIEKLLEPTGITINGNNSWDIQVKNPSFYKRVLQQHSLGLGESYMDGWWECERLDEAIYRLLSARIEKVLKTKLFKEAAFFQMGLRLFWVQAKHRLFNYQSRSKAYEVGEEHYDLGNDLYKVMLDPELTYTCAYWKEATNLVDAQNAKLKLVCDKLRLRPGQKILDIGCGWGSFARFAAKNYGVSVHGVTVSKEQKALTDALNKDLPITIELQDYREINGKFDHIVSLGMFEHVGHKNYRTFMKVANRCLKDDGLFLLHTIGNNETYYATNAWVQKYIFPNGMLPSIAQIGQSVENLFVVEDLHNFGADYDKTLMAWHSQFCNGWDELKNRYDERFFRMWSFYLLSCAGGFRARSMQLWQWVLSKHGEPNGYIAVR